MNLYSVKAIKDRKIKKANGIYFTADEGYVVYSCIQGANTPDEARKTVESYYIRGKDYDRVTVEFIRKD